MSSFQILINNSSNKYSFSQAAFKITTIMIYFSANDFEENELTCTMIGALLKANVLKWQMEHDFEQEGNVLQILHTPPIRYQFHHHQAPVQKYLLYLFKSKNHCRKLL